MASADIPSLFTLSMPSTDLRWALTANVHRGKFTRKAPPRGTSRPPPCQFTLRAHRGWCTSLSFWLKYFKRRRPRCLPQPARPLPSQMPAARQVDAPRSEERSSLVRTWIGLALQLLRRLRLISCGTFREETARLGLPSGELTNSLGGRHCMLSPIAGRSCPLVLAHVQVLPEGRNSLTETVLFGVVLSQICIHDGAVLSYPAACGMSRPRAVLE